MTPKEFFRLLWLPIREYYCIDDNEDIISCSYIKHVNVWTCLLKCAAAKRTKTTRDTCITVKSSVDMAFKDGRIKAAISLSFSWYRGLQIKEFVLNALNNCSLPTRLLNYSM